MASVTVLSMVRNEADRYLGSALDVWSSFADKVVVLDDASTDTTRSLCEAHGAQVFSTAYSAPAWGSESHARALLWKLGAESGSDWLFFLDADMIPARDPRDLFRSGFDAVSFCLYDLWSHDSHGLLYRSDNFWYGHESSRVWAVRNPGSDFQAHWSPRGIHCGHLPENLQTPRTLYAPKSYGLLHYAYLEPSDREAKLRQYMSVSKQLSEFEHAHAASIVDQRPNLERLSFQPQWTLSKPKESNES